MIYLIQSTDRWIFLALAIIVLILLGMVFKYVFRPFGAVADIGISNQKGAKGVNKPVKNTDFFRTGRANTGKSISVFVEKENKHYYLIDMGNNKILIMEEDICDPEQRDEQLTKQFFGVGDIVVNDYVEVSPEANEHDQMMAEQILNDEKNARDIEEMSQIIENQKLAFSQDQKDLYRKVTQENLFSDEELNELEDNSEEEEN